LKNEKPGQRLDPKLKEFIRQKSRNGSSNLYKSIEQMLNSQHNTDEVKKKYHRKDIPDIKKISDFDLNVKSDQIKNMNATNQEDWD